MSFETDESVLFIKVSSIQRCLDRERDSTLWYSALLFNPDYLLSLQKCNLLQRYNTSTWLELAEAYTELGIHHAMMSEAMAAKNSNTASKFSNSRDVSSQSSGKGVHDCVDDKNSKVGTENDVMESIFSNTVTLFRPYFKWQTENIDCKNFDPSLVTVVALLGRCVSVDNFLQDVQQLPWERNKQMLKLLFQVSSCCCLIWARYIMSGFYTSCKCVLIISGCMMVQDFLMSNRDVPIRTPLPIFSVCLVH